MAPDFSFRILVVILLTQVGCVKVYAPPKEPLTEDSLSQAIEILQATDENLAVLEDGFEVEAYAYEWERMPLLTERQIREVDLAGVHGDRQMRVLRGPKRGVYVPYASIRSVGALSWPSWSAVEIVVVGPDGRTAESPVVIRARDDEEARRLAAAIDHVRRARQPEPVPGEEPGAAD